MLRKTFSGAISRSILRSTPLATPHTRSYTTSNPTGKTEKGQGADSGRAPQDTPSNSITKKASNMALKYKALQESYNILAEPAQESQIDKQFMPSIGTPGTSLYDPFDFSLAKKFKDKRLRKEQSKVDRFEATGINPLDLWKSPDVLSHFITSNGKIIPAYVSGTKSHNHRKLAKAVRRARAAGLLSTVHRSVFSMNLQ